MKTILNRHSVRTFEKVFLSTKDKKMVQDVLEEHNAMQGPFANAIKTHFVENVIPGKKEGIIGTYGFVKNAPAFVVGVATKDFNHLVDFGYVFEHVILKLTEKNLGTVWLGGTFKRSNFDVPLETDEFIPAVSPVGYPAEKPSLREKTVRTIAGSDTRKAFDELFYEKDFDTPLTRSKIPILSPVLDLVQKGPSASNKQPWRLLVDGKNVHVYLKENPKYIGNYIYNIQALDAGIAIAHFELGLKDKNIAYTMKAVDDAPTHDDLRYIITFKLKKSPQ